MAGQGQSGPAYASGPYGGPGRWQPPSNPFAPVEQTGSGYENGSAWGGDGGTGQGWGGPQALGGPVARPPVGAAGIPGYKKGGIVKKTGIALVHKGERVLTKKQNKRFSKANPAVKASHRGRLHKALGVPEGQNIPIGKIHAAMQSKNAHLRKQAAYAETMSHWGK